MRIFFFGCVVCALLSCSFVLSSSDIQFSQLKFDSDLDRYVSTKKTEVYLLARLNSFYNGDQESGVKKPLDLEHTDTTSEMYLKQSPSSFLNIPFHIIVHVLFEKYLDTKDLMKLSSTCKLFFLLVQSATESNLSSFCPYFVLPDPKLNIIFYYDVVRYLNVDNLNDNKIHDAFELYQIQQLDSVDSKPALQAIKPVLDSLHVFLHEIVMGLNCRIPDIYVSSDFEQFNNFIQIHGPDNNCSMTLEYIQKLPADNFWKKGFEDIIHIHNNSSEELNQEEVRKAFEQREQIDFDSYNIDFSRMKSYFECLVLDPEFSSLGYSFGELDVFKYLIANGIFSSDLFKRLVSAGEDFSNFGTRNNTNMEFALALMKLDEPARGKAIYILTRTALDPFDYNQYCSISGDKYIFYAFKVLLQFENITTNLAHSNTLFQILRHQIFDFTTIDAPNRTFLLESLVKSPRISDILKLFQYEGLSPINLLICERIGERDFFDGQIHDTIADQNFLEFNADMIFYLRSISDDPLPLLLFPIKTLIELTEYIREANFDINKKYFLDYDRSRIKFLKWYLDIDFNFKTIIDFKTIVKMLINDYNSGENEEIRSCFVADITRFEEPTPEDIKPISLDRYFKYVVFETVHIENPKMHPITYLYS